MASCELDDYRWLTSEQARPYLQAAAAMNGTPAEIARLRRELSPTQTHLVMEQAQLRRRATAKFGRASEMFFTRRGLEQATDQTVAGYKAARMAVTSATAGLRCDLCCGIGGDLLSMAAAMETATLAPGGKLLAVDADPVVAHLAEANANVLGHGASVRVVAADVMAAEVQTAIAESEAWHIDPDRRPSGKRRTRLEAFSPPLEKLQQLLSIHPAAAFKLAPASELPADWKPRMEREWIGFQGECRQQVAWGEPLARHVGRRTAAVLDAAHPRMVVGPVGEAPVVPMASAPGAYLFEPHAAVLAAHLADVLAAEHGLQRLSPNVAYYTGERPIEDAALSAFEVLETLPLRAKEIARWLAAQGIGRVEVKKRGVDIDPLKLQRQWQGSGKASATVILCPTRGRTVAYITHRLSPVGLQSQPGSLT